MVAKEEEDQQNQNNEDEMDDEEQDMVMRQDNIIKVNQIVASSADANGVFTG